MHTRPVASRQLLLVSHKFRITKIKLIVFLPKDLFLLIPNSPFPSVLLLLLHISKINGIIALVLTQ